jgi:hypothetical protein
MCKPPDARELIERLKNDYKREHYQNLQRSLGAITQDYISRGLANSTAHATDRWAAHDRYVRGLREYTLSSVRNEGGNVNRGDLRRTMLSLVESEYNRVKGDVLQTLISAGLSDPSVRGQYESTVEQSIQKATFEINRELSPHEALQNRTHVTTSERAESSDAATLVDGWKQKALNNRVLAVCIAAGLVVIFVAAVVTGINTIRDFIRPSPIATVKSQPPQRGAVKEATDPNGILQNGSVVGTVVGKVERKDSRVVFQMLAETSHLDEQSPFVYKGTTYQITTIGKRSGTHISNIYGMNRDVKSDVICEVLR